MPEFLRISKIFLQAVPDEVDPNLLRNKIHELDHVQALSHFHIWSTDGQQHMMSLTVTTDADSEIVQENIKQNIRHIILEYNISHITIEVLYDPKQVIKSSQSCEA